MPFLRKNTLSGNTENKNKVNLIKINFPVLLRNCFDLLHCPVPRLALESAIPRLIGMFKEAENSEVSQEWQKAIAVLCLPLVVAAREAEKSKNLIS